MKECHNSVAARHAEASGRGISHFNVLLPLDESHEQVQPRGEGSKKWDQPAQRMDFGDKRVMHANQANLAPGRQCGTFLFNIPEIENL